MSYQPTLKPATHVPRPKKLFSKDGTAIAFDRVGDGPPVILVDGALCYRAFGSSRPLAKLLAQHFTVFTYDRRGRGDSGDTAPYAVEREVEDIEAARQRSGWRSVYLGHFLRCSSCARGDKSPHWHQEGCAIRSAVHRG